MSATCRRPSRPRVGRTRTRDLTFCWHMGWNEAMTSKANEQRTAEPLWLIGLRSSGRTPVQSLVGLRARLACVRTLLRRHSRAPLRIPCGALAHRVASSEQHWEQRRRWNRQAERELASAFKAGIRGFERVLAADHDQRFGRRNSSFYPSRPAQDSPRPAKAPVPDRPHPSRPSGHPGAPSGISCGGTPRLLTHASSTCCTPDLNNLVL